ncbi:MAG TPA: BrnA antitoxin family protein [Blastocatellia bacterium]|nr:BrnA antitoxin family protein [Blastocatellia bacterium]
MKKEYDFSKGRRGAVVTAAPGKTRITIRLDEEVLAWFRNLVSESGGGNYQILINKTLREYISQKQEPLEKVIRRVVREEIKRIA